MSVPPNKVIRVTPPTGGIHALATNRDYTTGAGLLTDEDMSITTSGRLGVWMGHRMIVGEISDHGEVADEAAMLTLHDWPDDPHTRSVYHYVAPGDSCTRADDPGYRWVCRGNHGYSLADWERRPLAKITDDLRADIDELAVELSTKIGSSALDGYYTSSEVDDLLDTKIGSSALDGYYTSSEVDDLLDGKQDSLTISAVGEAMLALATPSGKKIPQINADGSVTLIDVPSGGGGSGGSRGLYSGLMSEKAPTQSSTGLTTWVNQGGATAADTPIGLQVVNPTTSSDDNIRGLVRAVPATPYTLTALLELASISGNYPSALLGWADSESTKTHAVSICGDGRSGLVSPTGYSLWSFSGAPAFTRDGRRVWLRFSDDGTAIAVQWSISGVYWHTLYSGAKASSHLGSEGYNRLFFGASSSSITGVATLLSWSIS